MTHRKLSTLFALLLLVGLTFLFFWKILLTNLILSGVDVFLYFYPYKAYAAEALRQGRLPLWNPHLFMGAPLLANSQVGLFYFPNWLLIWLDAPKQVSWAIGLHVALAALLMLLFVRQSLALSWPAALIAAILFAFGGYLGAQVEHVNQLQVAAWLPLLFLLYDFSLHRPKRWFWLLLLALVVALTLLAGHTQTVFISLFGLGLYGLWQAMFEPPKTDTNQQKLPSSGLWAYGKQILGSLIYALLPLAAMSILAAAVAAVQLIPTAELSGLSIRSQGLTYQEVVSFSLRPTNLHYSLLPPLGLDLTQILGQAFSEWVAYLGITGLILALMGILTAIWQAPVRRFIFLSGSGLLLSLGLFSGPVYVVLYYFVPGFGLFRVPARWLLLYAFGMAILAAFGTEGLLSPNLLKNQLNTTRRWFTTGPRWRWLLFLLPALFLLALVAWKTPPLATLAAWLILATLTLGLIYIILKYAPTNLQKITLLSPTVPAKIKVSAFALFLLLLAELFWAAQSLNYNRPTAPQAYHSMRNATAFLLAADPPNDNTPPDRFLSLSGITYDPGDLVDLQQLFGDSLSENALYNLIVATKEKEVLFFNLPLIYGLHSVDGYDGGILPLAQFIEFQKLFLPEDDLSIDGRLREKLRFVPNNKLLSMINTRWIVTDKQFDAWINGIFYDLQFPAYLTPGKTISTVEIPSFPATAIGLVSHLENAAALPVDTPAAKITLTFAGGSQHSFTLLTGIDTAEANYTAEIAHPQATIGVTWPYKAGGVDYISVEELPVSDQITEITIESLLPDGQFVLRGLSLIHQPTTTSRSVMLSTEGDYRQVHSGDVKIYENRNALPRAFIVHQAKVVADDTQAVAVMQSPQFDPLQTMVHTAVSGQNSGLVTNGKASAADKATIVFYAPERVEIETTLNSPGWLVLSNSHYPGWQATVNGQPVDILQANILFRAVPLPEGKHTVVFEFAPQSVRVGALISGVSLLGIAIALVIVGKKKRS